MPLLLLALALPTTVPPMLEAARLVVARITVERVARRAVPMQETPRMVRPRVQRRLVKVKQDSSSNKTVSRRRMTNEHKPSSRPRSRPNNKPRPCSWHRPGRLRILMRLLQPLLKHKHRHKQ